MDALKSLPVPAVRVSQLGSTSGGGQFGQNGQKLHENDKIGIFGSKQWGEGETWRGEGRPISRVVGGSPSNPPTRGNPGCYVDQIQSQCDSQMKSCSYFRY